MDASQNVNISDRSSSDTVYEFVYTTPFDPYLLQQEHMYFKTYAYVFASAVVFNIG